MTGGRMAVDIRTEKEQKSTQKIVNSLEVWINSITGGSRPYQSHSGGEKVKIALAVSAALASIGAQAQESVRTEEVRVTASRVEQELMDVPMSVSVVTAQEIEQGSGKTVADFLDDIPGVEVQNDGSQGLKRLQIRGESPFRTV